MSVSPLLVCGPSSPPCSLTIGTVTSASTAAASVTGTAPNQTLNLTIPAGATGPNLVDTSTATTMSGFVKADGAHLFATTFLAIGDVLNLGSSLSTKEATANKNQANGYAGLDSAGLVPAALLPSYVDDVLEYTNLAGFPGTGETGKIYVDKATGKIYRWSGTVYVEISPSPGSTDSVTEGSTNLYFTEARVRATLLTGLVAAGSLAAPAATDSELTAWGKVLKLYNTFLSADPLTQYAILAGRSGGQTIQGDTATGGNLTLQSTAHATKGKIVLGSASAYDQANDRLGLGVTSPGVKLDLSVASGSCKGRLNSAAGSQSTLVFRDGGTDKWEFGKQTDNSFFFYNSTTAHVNWSILGDDVTFNSSSAGNTFFLTKVRIGGSATPTYECDVTGTVNASTGYRVGGVAGYTGTITNGLFSSYDVVGGIITAVRSG